MFMFMCRTICQPIAKSVHTVKCNTVFLLLKAMKPSQLCYQWLDIMLTYKFATAKISVFFRYSTETFTCGLNSFEFSCCIVSSLPDLLHEQYCGLEILFTCLPDEWRTAKCSDQSLRACICCAFPGLVCNFIFVFFVFFVLFQVKCRDPGELSACSLQYLCARSQTWVIVNCRDALILYISML